MKSFLLFIRATLAGGILFLVPIIVVAIFVNKALNITDKAVAPVATHIPIDSLIGLRTPKILAVGFIVLFCFLTGIFAQTMLARRIANWLDTAVLSNLPGYEFFKGVGESVLGVKTHETQQVVLVRFDDNWQIGFLADRLDNGLLSVFVPDAPNPHSGAVYFVAADRITPTGIPPQAILKCLKRLGAGSNELLGSLSISEAAPKSL